MKFSFSNKGWHNHTFEEFCNIASEMSFQGIELHNINNRLFEDKDGAFYNYAAAAAVRRLYEKKLSIPCIDAICNPSDATQKGACVAEIRKCMEIASNLHIPNIRLRANNAEDEDSAVANTAAVIAELLPEAEKHGVSLLMETAGLFAKTEKLRVLLDSFASDHFASLWNFSAAYFEGGESPEQIIKNLGAYVRHVHINDAKRAGDAIEYCLLGEGELPTKDMMLALRSVNYDGFLSLVWDPAWCEELDDMEIIF